MLSWNRMDGVTALGSVSLRDWSLREYCQMDSCNCPSLDAQSGIVELLELVV